jgi:hypothetical protein
LGQIIAKLKPPVKPIKMGSLKKKSVDHWVPVCLNPEDYFLFWDEISHEDNVNTYFCKRISELVRLLESTGNKDTFRITYLEESLKFLGRFCAVNINSPPIASVLRTWELTPSTHTKYVNDEVQH